MTKKRAQTRVVAMVDGALRRLMSIYEKPNGGLNISLSLAPFNFPQDHKNFIKKTDTQKYSIHPINDWGGNSIHHTLSSEDGSRIDTYTDTLCVKNRLVEPLYFHTHRNIRNETADVSIGSRDFPKKIANYNPSSSILHTAVFLAHPQSTRSAIARSPLYERHILTFSQFSLIILTSYTYWISPEEGSIVHFMSKPMIVNDQGRGVQTPAKTGLDAELARAVAIQVFSEAHSTAYRIARRKIEEMSDAPSDATLIADSAFGTGLHRYPYILSK